LRTELASSPKVNLSARLGVKDLSSVNKKAGQAKDMSEMTTFL